jgi:hypothetical protein
LGQLEEKNRTHTRKKTMACSCRFAKSVRHWGSIRSISFSALSRQMTDLLLEFRLARTASVEHRRGLTEHEQRIVDLENVVETMQRALAVYVPLTPAQQEFIARSIKQIAQRYQKQTGKDLFGQLFAEFCKTHGTPRYDELPSNKYEAAVAWIQAKARQLLPDDPDAVPPMQHSLL